MNTPTRVAVIGVGALGEHHARIYANRAEAQLVTVVDLRPERARAVAQKYKTRASGDFETILDEVEAVSVAVPTVAHCEVVCACLERSINVLVEKPIATNMSEARSMLDAAKEKKVILMVGHSERFNPAVVAIRPHVSEPLFFEGHRMSVYSGRSLDVDVVLDLMIHDLDLVLEFTPSPLKEIRTAGIPILSSRIDIANARLEFENGCVANLTASRVSSEKIRKLRFFQANNYISIDFAAKNAKMYSLVGHLGARRIVPGRLRIDKIEPLEREIEIFLKSVRAGKSAPLAPAADGRAGARALEVALKLLKAMDRQRARKR